MKREKCALPNAKYTNMLVYFALGNAKFWRRGHCPTPTPDARYFAFWWNIGSRVHPAPDVHNLAAGCTYFDNFDFRVFLYIHIFFPLIRRTKNGETSISIHYIGLNTRKIRQVHDDESLCTRCVHEISLVTNTGNICILIPGYSNTLKALLHYALSHWCFYFT